MRLSTDQARARFAAARVARLATVSAAGVPHLVPITFALLDDQIVFVVDDKPKRTTRLRRMDNIAAQPAVCVLVDVYDDDWSRLWWVRADGRATVHDTGTAIDTGAAIDTDRAIDALAARYPAYRQRRPPGPVVAIAVTRWTGWAAAESG
ncbi:TIGR03668 family PPOX class F420-dependent oxidoreductase [Nakamurella multipartita]|jgi:PPOX class probable F420-dependent enzyme|uniref:Pyridoxamine 5'-phosphate oxidase-related FMN-binding n=1 Tax=Nakamurella multipartita (strain ATCC 700099 / DSM 44233 / CIP 104796 / JCM 9543 / NBRC 105858 / Y-104) TaxID=479431 RepID=C8XI32_NAKMY|nr:TIGR03668 family PPOX class F420-dependent oxidoreductase [Nakamurella multipartita]ACV78401.1 pyridoxamine 5'-phosphate oxidase-related FMN- binding [Nakamurella multipartita DSM 44233]